MSILKLKRYAQTKAALLERFVRWQYNAYKYGLTDQKLNIEVIDCFGHPVIPQEWFLVPLFIIDEVVEKITYGMIGDYYYDKTSVALQSNNGV